MVNHQSSIPSLSQPLVQLPDSALQQLHDVLEKMNVCARELEKITQAEYEAIRQINADHIMQLSDHRISAHQCLAQLEAQCRELLKQYDIADDLSLSVVIDMYAGAQVVEFQALRRNVYDRMLKVDQDSQDNRLRLHAAYSVSSSILQGLGLTKAEHTYQRRTNG